MARRGYPPSLPIVPPTPPHDALQPLIREPRIPRRCVPGAVAEQPCTSRSLAPRRIHSVAVECPVEFTTNSQDSGTGR
jgi:hypothetical protein